MNRFYLFLLVVLLSGAALAPTARAQQPAAGQTLKLVKIDFTGLQRVKKEEAIAASGLVVGQLVDEAALDAAANALAKSGLFTTLSYSRHIEKDQASVTFAVEEAKVRLPVVFDNFIWFTDEELIAAVRREVPVFDGTSPETGDVVDGIKSALMGLLRQKKIAGTVDFAPTTDANLKVTGMRFIFKGDALNVCSINFPGAAEIEETVLQGKARFVLGKEYSREYTSGFAQETLIPLYRKRGMLKAAFGTPVGKPGTSAECHDGVAVTVPLDEGATYHFAAIDWAGNVVMEGPELSHAFDMKPGELADGLKLDAAFDAVRRAYSKTGYIQAKLVQTPEYDDAKKTIGYHVAVTEGQQFLMGSLNIVGLPEAETARLKAAWKLQPGDVFDGTYVDEFNKNVIGKDLDLNELTKKLNLLRTVFSTKPDPGKRTVEVTISFLKPL